MQATNTNHKGPVSFKCKHCGKIIDDAFFDVAKAFEHVDYTSTPATVDVQNAEAIAEFCSIECRDAEIDSVMQQQGVPMREVGIEPGEPCACCGQPVEMTEPHLTYTGNEMRILANGDLMPVDTDYLAVVCRRCTGAVGVGAAYEANIKH